MDTAIVSVINSAVVSLVLHAIRLVFAGARALAAVWGQ
jgi:hypothetical protein